MPHELLDKKLSYTLVTKMLLTLMFRNLWENTELVPHKYKNAKVISLYKKGDQMDPGNYRSLFMLDTEGKCSCHTCLLCLQCIFQLLYVWLAVFSGVFP